MEEKKKEVFVDFMNEILGRSSKKLVGKCLKRFEIIEDKPTLKNSLKELIYESFRDMTDVFCAYKMGLEFSSFKFISKPKSEGKNGK